MPPAQAVLSHLMHRAGQFALITTLLTSTTCAQFTPAVNAIKLPDSLVFVTASSANQSAVAWRPSCAKYYSIRTGNGTFPLETWDASGGLSVYQTTTGLDIRGMWWNPNTQQLECNRFSAGGWGTIPLDPSCNALSTSAANTLFNGMNQPNTNAVGAYDWNTNTVLFYQTGNLYVYSRTDASLLAILPLTGTSLVNVNTTTVICTGQSNYEIGLLDHVAKRILLFRRSDGAFTGMSQLPAAATTTSSYRFSYANNRVWLYTATPRTWNAYCIWNETCGWSTLPVQLLDHKAACNDGTPELTWATSSEHNNSHFTIERSGEAENWEPVGRVNGVGNSQQLTEYSWRDERPLTIPISYYRLRQVDLDGQEEVFAVLPLNACISDIATLSVLPNPTDGIVEARWTGEDAPRGIAELRLLDAQGRVLHTMRVADVADVRWLLDLSALAPGTYALLCLNASGALMASTRVVRQ